MRKHNITNLSIGLICFLVIFLFTSFIYIFEAFELKMLDFRFKFRGNITPEENIIIVAIDEKSIDKFGRWPWKRIYHSELIDILYSEKAKIIFFDIFFLEKSQEHPEYDEKLFSSVAKAKNVIFDYPLLSEEPIDDKMDKRIYPFLEKFSRKQKDMKNLNFIEEKTALFPLEKILSSAKGIGHATIYDDVDHIFRKTSLFVKYKDRIYPFSSLVVALEYYNLSLADIKTNKNFLYFDKIKIPINKISQMYINYCGEANTFPYISYYDVISKKFKKDFFKDKIVLIGGTASGLFDIRPTPYGQMPGIEMIANSLNTLISRNFITRASNFINIFILFLLCMLISFVVGKLSLFTATLSTIFIFLFYFTWCIFLFEKHGVFLNMVSPLSSIVLTYSVVIIYRYLTTEKEKKKIKNAFQHYVASSVVSEILKNPDALKLGGEKKVLTVLFSDIRGFTALSEKLQPEEVVSILNEYFTEMTDIIFKYEGTLDKFIGDAIMVIYGAPVYFRNHAERAVKTALEMRDKMKDLQNKWLSQNRKSFSIGIGINTGEMVVGNMGSRERWDYTVIGDAVNLTSRLEHATRDFNVDIIISEETYKEVKDIITVRELGEVLVKGKQKPILIYEVIGAK